MWKDVLETIQHGSELLDAVEPHSAGTDPTTERIDDLCARFCALRTWPQMTKKEILQVMLRVEWALALVLALGQPVVPFPEPEGFSPWPDETQFLMWLFVGTREAGEAFLQGARALDDVQKRSPSSERGKAMGNGANPS